jgi:hypothetical protein
MQFTMNNDFSAAGAAVAVANIKYIYDKIK